MDDVVEIDAPTHDAEESARWEEAVAAFRKLVPPAGFSALAGLMAGCPAPVESPDTEPANGTPELPDNLRRLVSRTTFGIDAAEAQRALDLGYDGYLEYQLAHDAIDDRALDGALASLTTLNQSPLERLRALEAEDFTGILEFYAATLLRGAYSKRQLYERMVEFWSDHFNIFFESEAQQILKPADDAEVIRPNALGAFPALLDASMRSPAMLIYLDNASSFVGAPNENYARELMELHTLGVDNFSQEDVKEVARALTGWSIAFDANVSDFGTFRFYPQLHDYGAKRILGQVFTAGRGMAEGEALVDLLTRDPSLAPVTARHVGRKLAVHFWGYDPPDALVTEIVEAYLDADGDIKAMLRVVLREDWLLQAPPKLKRPYHFALSALRARPSEIRDFQALAYIIQTMQHFPFQWAPPNGYPDSLEYWGNSLTPRWTYGVWLVYQAGAVQVDWAPYFAAEDSDAFLDQLDADFFHHAMPTSHREALRAYLAPAPTNFFRRVEALSLAIGSAEFQWY